MFGPVATSYEDARPDYPDRVFEVLRERCGLGPSTRVVEIGAGSGKATRRLLEAGAHVLAIEPSRPLAEELRARFSTVPRLDIVGAPFEDAHLSPSSFDLVVAATAFHWLDPGPTLPKIVSILRPGGWLALWWNVFGDPDLPDPFHDATEQILNDLEPSPRRARRQCLSPSTSRADLGTRGLGVPERRVRGGSMDADARLVADPAPVRRRTPTSPDCRPLEGRPSSMRSNASRLSSSVVVSSGRWLRRSTRRAQDQLTR